MSSSWVPVSRHAAVVNVHDPVTVADRGEAMGDDKRSPSLKHGIETGLQGFFRLHVNAGGGFVEDQDGRIRKQRPGKGDKLLLSLTQHGARAPGPPYHTLPASG